MKFPILETNMYSLDEDKIEFALGKECTLATGRFGF